MAGIGVRKQIQLVQLATATDGSGFVKPAEAVIWSGWAEVSNPSGFREYMEGTASVGNVKQFKIRHNLTVMSDADTRVVYAGKRYTVTSIRRDEEKKFYTIIRATAQDAGRI